MCQKAYNQISQSAIYKEDDVSVSITVCGGSYGGGSEVLIVETQQRDNTESVDMAARAINKDIYSKDYQEDVK